MINDYTQPHPRLSVGSTSPVLFRSSFGNTNLVFLFIFSSLSSCFNKTWPKSSKYLWTKLVLQRFLGQPLPFSSQRLFNDMEHQWVVYHIELTYLNLLIFIFFAMQIEYPWILRWNASAWNHAVGSSKAPKREIKNFYPSSCWSIRKYEGNGKPADAIERSVENPDECKNIWSTRDNMKIYLLLRRHDHQQWSSHRTSHLCSTRVN